jgi:hypothetical protein
MHIHTERFAERLDEMVEAGRLTEEEADRLRAAAGPGEFDDVVRETRHEHTMLALVILVLGALASRAVLHRHMTRWPHRHAPHGAPRSARTRPRRNSALDE